ncbi:MAG: DEAD/DEAH box helicase family protein [Saprospiraceae bacterium]|nr:DEAD/DEAH box helicase family protein [Saprospiraceae bacterium]
MAQIKFYEHQTKTIRYMLEHIQDERMCICAPTGSGKTMSFSGYSAEYLKRNPKHRILIAVNRIELLKQTTRTLHKNFGIHAGVIIADVKAKPATSVTVCMVETLFRRLDRWNFSDIDVLIIDECHIGDFFKILSVFKKIIGFSATPMYQKRDSCLADYYHNIFIPTSLKELIKLNLLANAVTYAPEHRLGRKSIKVKSDGEYDTTEMGKELSKVSFIDQVVNYWAKFKDKRAMVYNSSIEHSLEVTKALKLAGANARHLDGSTPDHERKHIFQWLAATPGAWLCNVGVATTGVDVPEVEVIMINRLIRSLTLYLQMAGRGSRTIKPGESNYVEYKDTFTILDMHGNCASLGEWQDERDWENLFREKKRKKDGVAPIKMCPSCDAVIPASATSCKFCGAIFEKPRSQNSPEFDPNLIIVSKVRDDARELITFVTNRKYKPVAVLFKARDLYARELQEGHISVDAFENKMLIVATEYYKSQGYTEMNYGHKQYVAGLIKMKLDEIGKRANVSLES